MANDLLLYVLLDIEAGLEREALAGLARNLESEVGGRFGATAIWEIHHSCDLAVELRLQEPGAIAELDELLVDKVRSVPGVRETSIRPIYHFRFIDKQGSQRAYNAALSDSPEVLGVVLLDVACGKDRSVREALLGLKDGGGVVPVDVETAFHSVEFDMSLLLVGPSEASFHGYVKQQVRAIDGISDTVLEVWEIARVLTGAEEFVQGWSSMSEDA